MKTIALIGADGSGKTTVAKKIMQSPPVPLKYLYMGLNIESSNYALPTSRLAYKVKLWEYKRKHKHLKNVELKNISLHQIDDNRRGDPRGKVGATARLVKRVSEELYRLFISWTFQIRGYNVLFDRHFIFDAATSATGEELKKQRFTNKIHRWFLNKVYSKPDLVIFLNAPAEVLYERKHEVDVEYLKTRTETFLKVGKALKNFVIVDTTQPIEKVFNEVNNTIIDFVNNGKSK
jgi:broad-specificity NMP kinase